MIVKVSPIIFCLCTAIYNYYAWHGLSNQYLYNKYVYNVSHGLYNVASMHDHLAVHAHKTQPISTVRMRRWK